MPSTNSTFGSDDAVTDGNVDDMAGSDDAASEDDTLTTCKNNAVLSPLDDTAASSIEITSQANHGACAILVDSIVYYPIPNYLGMDVCEYSVCMESEMSGELNCTSEALIVEVVECPIWGVGTASPSVGGGDVPTMSPTCDYAVSCV